MSFTSLLLESFAQDEPATASQGMALYLNPLEIAAASENSPVIQTVWHPYNMVTSEDGATGEIWSFSADGASASIETPGFEDGFEYMLVGDDLSTSITAVINTAAYQETPAIWAPDTLVMDIPGSSYIGSFISIIYMPRETRRIHQYDGISSVWDGLGGGTGMVPLRFHGFSFNLGTAHKVQKMRLTASTGTIDGGQVRLFRRKLYG